MSDKAQQMVQDGIKDLIEKIDKDHLRKIQGEMHRCAAKCCDQTDLSLNEVHNCISKCSSEVSKAQNYMSNELANFQNRLERCAMQCQDDIRDKIGPNASEGDVDKFRNKYEDCIVKCADSHVKLLPTMLKRMKEMMGKGNYSGSA
ncbi:protein FAM136A [Tetranychus urticae]|uniref:Protein FAM136A n=1 Tax=Tetranychus urticae TaxID=32264 RepID=T1KTS0_TETUR|nr:protein FAM136A [Tetranychus urticae]